VGIHIQWITGILRAGETLQKFGDDFKLACCVQVSGDVAHLCGGAGKLSLENARLFVSEMVSVGVKVIEYERIKNGKTIRIRRRIQEEE